MALDFPSSPVDGQTATFGSTIFQYNASKTTWDLVTSTITGPQGDPGTDGVNPTVAVGTTTTGVAGSSASVNNSGTSSAAVFDFTIPRGDTGATGTAATIAVGTTTTGSAGSSASVTNSGTSSAATFNFTIPRGDTGATGPAAYQTIPYNRSGTVAVVTGTQKFRFPAAATLVGASLVLGTAGSTTTTVVIKKNGTALTWASALSMGSGVTSLAEQAISGTATVAAGDYLTVDITAAGTSATDLGVFIRYY